MTIPNTQNYFGARFPEYQPANRNILSITNSNPMIVTTTFDGTTPGINQYGNGLIVKLFIPEGFGMDQARNLEAPITIIDTTSFAIHVDSTNFIPFIIPDRLPGFYATPAQVIPVGEITSTLLQSTRNVLPYP